jgi:molybdopterin-guanine dinucleotide biosynthesis protein B
MDVPPPVLCIVGKKDSGKTELTVALSAELNRRGLRVMTVKHGHGFQLDQPGRDSWRHRHEGGAFRSVLAAPGDFAVVGNWPGEEMPLAEIVRRFLGDGDIVLVEGFKRAPHPRIVVFRRGQDPGPFLDDRGEADQETVAVVTDHEGYEAAVPVFRAGDPEHIAALADLVQERSRRGMNP